MIVAAYVIAGLLSMPGVYLIATGVYLLATARRARQPRTDMTAQLVRYQPIADQARHWLDQQDRRTGS
jgi:hypothetical protein